MHPLLMDAKWVTLFESLITLVTAVRSYVGVHQLVTVKCLGGFEAGRTLDTGKRALLSVTQQVCGQLEFDAKSGPTDGARVKTQAGV